MIRLILLSFCSLLIGIGIATAKNDGLSLPKIYEGSVQRVIDGDTIVVNVKLWPTLNAEVPVRLLGIDVPERGDKCEKAINMRNDAKSYLQKKLPPGTRVQLHDVQKGKWGTRVVAWIKYKPKKKNWANLADKMKDKRLACAYDQKRRGKWCTPFFNPCW